jgi:nucleoside-diphosphate-sugar epimerase
VPLPLGAVHNLRSLVALDNLVDLIVRCVDHPAAANKVFLVSDGEDLSTPQLLRRVAGALGRSARLPRVPEGVLRLVARCLGAGEAMQRLCESLQVDIRDTRRSLDWSPPASVDESLRKTVAAFLAQNRT